MNPLQHFWQKQNRTVTTNIVVLSPSLYPQIKEQKRKAAPGGGLLVDKLVSSPVHRWCHGEIRRSSCSGVSWFARLILVAVSTGEVGSGSWVATLVGGDWFAFGATDGWFIGER